MQHLFYSMEVNSVSIRTYTMSKHDAFHTYNDRDESLLGGRTANRNKLHEVTWFETQCNHEQDKATVNRDEWNAEREG